MFARAETRSAHATLLLSDLFGTRSVAGVLAAAAAVSAAFADEGRPLVP